MSCIFTQKTKYSFFNNFSINILILLTLCCLNDIISLRRAIYGYFVQFCTRLKEIWGGLFYALIQISKVKG